MKEFAEAAGLRETDMPSDHHPLLENDEEVRELSDLIDVRSDRTEENRVEGVRDDKPLDIENALTFPHKKRVPTSADLLPELSDFDADARGHTEPDDEDDASYMTRADFESSMLETDPDPNEGMDADSLPMGDGRGRAPDMTGTVQGVSRGTSTHLVQDLGGDGFQIREPEELNDPRVSPEDEGMDDSVEASVEQWMNDDDNDAGVLPVAHPSIRNRDESLDATRQLE